MIVVHAAINAITSKTKESIEGCTIYLTHFPDDDCAHAILTAGIKEIVYCMFTRELNFRKDQDCKWITEANKILEQRNIEIRYVTNFLLLYNIYLFSDHWK